MNDKEEHAIRVFMGIPLSPEARRHVASIARELAERVQGVRWVAHENLHVTLKFIGNCNSDMLESLVEVMRKASANLPLNLRVGGIGGFPSQGSARVVWVGAQDEENKVGELYDALDIGTRKLGFAGEKRAYRAHITVGRARKTPVRLPTEIGGIENIGVELEVRDIVLFRSVLKKTGAEYSVIERVGVEE